MPELPSESDTRAYVREIVLRLARISNPDRIGNNSRLRDAPLSYDDRGLNNVVLALRAYIKQWQPKKTLLAEEARKKDMTLEGLASLVWQRINIAVASK